MLEDNRDPLQLERPERVTFKNIGWERGRRIFMETNQWHFGQRMETTTKSLGSMENARTVNLLMKVMWKDRGS